MKKLAYALSLLNIVLLFIGATYLNNSGSYDTISATGATYVISGVGAAISSDNYLPIGMINNSSSESNMTIAMFPRNATCINLRAAVVTAPGTGTSWTITLRAGAAGALSNTALTCTIADTATTCSDVTHSATPTAGQFGTFFWDATGSVASTTRVGVSMECS